MQWTWIGVTAALGVAGLAWLGEPQAPAVAAPEPHRLEVLTLSGEDAEQRRRALLRRAVFETDWPAQDTDDGGATDASSAAWRGAISDGSRPPDEPLECRFLPSPPSGTSPKFDCVLESGAVVKVKYGRNPEIHAETAATTLLRWLRYPADDVAIVPRVRCHGCPRFPFAMMTLADSFALPLASRADDGEYRDFTWVSVEQKFPAPAIETAEQSGWAWWELAGSEAPAADVDALRLTAMFLAHWDNKGPNQRLVCLDRPAPPPGTDCRRPLAMMQDLGATFGPSKANLARWQTLPVWSDRATCTISMAAMPYGGASFPAGRISEAGRAKLAARLAAVSDADAARLFAAARFPQFQAGTDDEGDLQAWVAAFRRRADEIIDNRCPEPPGET